MLFDCMFILQHSSYQLHWSQYSSMNSFTWFHFNVLPLNISADLHSAGESEHQLLPVYMYHLHLRFLPKLHDVRWPRRGNHWCFTVVFFVGLNIQWRWQCKLGFVSITTGSMPWPRWKYNFRCQEIHYQPLKQRKSFPHSVFSLHSNPVLQLRTGRTQTKS